MADTRPVLTPAQAVEALGLSYEVEPARSALGKPQVRVRAFRDESLVAVSMRDTEGEAFDAVYRSVTQPPARRTRK